jgi:hypothetical protein
LAGPLLERVVDKLRANGLRDFMASLPVRGEPFDSPFVLRLSKDERFAHDRPVEP